MSAAPQPGDILLVHRLDPFAIAIQVTQLAAGYLWPDARINHWQLVTAVGVDGRVSIVEAALGGVRERTITLRGPVDFVRPNYTDVNAGIAWAKTWNGTPYGFLDLPALLCTTLGWRPPWVRRVLERPSTIVCSQLGAGAAFAGGDNRAAAWPYFIPAACRIFV